MTVDIPEEITLEFAEDNVFDEDCAEYVNTNYLAILNRFKEDAQLPEICRALAFTLINMVDGKEFSDRTYQINRHTIDICRIGINSFSDEADKKTIAINHLGNSELEGDLLAYMATAMINCGRPISAFGYYDNAEKCYERAIELFGDRFDEYTDHLKLSYEHCRSKEAELYLRLIPDVPEKYKPMLSTVASSYLLHTIQIQEELGGGKNTEWCKDLIAEALLFNLRYPLLDQEQIDAMNEDSITDDYVRWCEENVRYLNLFNEIPHHNEKYACDDIILDLDERHQWLLEDIVKTYDHCRKIFYRICENPEEFISKSRDDDVESMIDCYVRLYTILDKSAKLIDYLFPREGDRDKLKFYDVAESLANSPNPYLKALYHINCDIFPDRYSNISGTFDPRNIVYGFVLKRGFIRNSIMHDTVKIQTEDEPKTSYYYVASVTPLELMQCTNMMFYDVREIILNIQLAYEYRKSN